MELALSLFYIILFVFLIRKSPFFNSGEVSNLFYVGFFLIKVVFSYLFFLVYFYYYGNDRMTADAFHFYDDALPFYEALKTNPKHYFQLIFGINLQSEEIQYYLNQTNFWTKEFNHGIYNDNKTIIRANALIMPFSFGYYHVHSIFFSFISFVGITAIYKSFISSISEFKIFSFLIIAAIPSLLFWASAPLKESLTFFPLGIAVYQLNKLKKTSTILLLTLCIALLCILKIYVIASLLLVITPFLLIEFKKWNAIKTYTLVGGSYIIMSIIIHFIVPAFSVYSKIKHKRYDFINQTNQSGAGSSFELSQIDSNPLSILKEIPESVFNSLFKPLLWEADSAFMLYNSLENMLLFMFLVVCLIFRKSWNKVNQNAFLFCIILTLSMYTYIGLVTPVSGAIVRYKAMAWPFFIIACFCILDIKKIGTKIPFLKPILK